MKFRFISINVEDSHCQPEKLVSFKSSIKVWNKKKISISKYFMSYKKILKRFRRKIHRATRVNKVIFPRATSSPNIQRQSFYDEMIAHKTILRSCANFLCWLLSSRCVKSIADKVQKLEGFHFVPIRNSTRVSYFEFQRNFCTFLNELVTSCCLTLCFIHHWLQSLYLIQTTCSPYWKILVKIIKLISTLYKKVIKLAVLSILINADCSKECRSLMIISS